MDEAAANRVWVEHWRRVGPLLEKVRHEELRAMTDEQAARVFESLSELAFDVRPLQSRATSGFVEQQRLFMKWARNVPPG